MNSRVIGFDFDQTLADSKPGIMACLEEVCNYFGLPIDENKIDLLAVSGLTLDLMLGALFETDQIERQRDKFLDIYPNLGVKGTKLIPGAQDLLRDLLNQGHRLVLISAKSARNLDLSLRHLGLEFSEVYGGAGGDIKSNYISKSGSQIYVGDQLSDVIAAKTANAKAVLVNEIPLKLETNVKPDFHFINLFELHNSIPLLNKK